MQLILPITGFTESRSERTGTEDLCYQVARQFTSPDVLLHPPVKWTDDMSELVDEFTRQGVTEVALITFSHGQAAGVDFIKAAYKRGLKVGLWLACDPVYRADWLPRLNITQIFSGRSLSKRPKIKAPRGVGRISYVTQTIRKPCGHEIVPFDDQTEIAHKIIYAPHTRIDEHAEWFALVSQELDKWVIQKPHKCGQ
jgi:hypothetical protein